MLYRLTLAALCLLVTSPAALACLNLYGTNVHGESVDMMDVPGYHADQLRRVEMDRAKWQAKEVELRQDLDEADFRHRSDYATTLIYLGRYDEAIEILEACEAEQPGEAIVATNLGTAYELSGDLEKALEWITIGFQRDPTDHQGSEWLHVQILEARIALADDPNWLKTHNVLGYDLGSDPAPIDPDGEFVDSLGNPHSLSEVAEAIQYQLHERLQFVSPPDPVVADLLFDLGNLLGLTHTMEEAVPVYEYAEEFGVAQPELLSLRTQHFKSRIGAASGGLADVVGAGGGYMALGLGVLAAIGVVVLLTVIGVILFRRSARRHAASEL